MIYSVDDLPTKAACDAVLAVIGREHDAAANRKSNLAFQLQHFGDAATIQAEITRLTTRITDGEADVSTMTEGKEKRDAEDVLSHNRIRRNDLLDRADKQGADGKVLKEFELAWVTQKLDESTILITQVETRKNALPS